MQLYASKYTRFLYIFTFLDSLLEGLQGFPTLKQIVSLNIGLKRIISDYNQGHIIRELRTRGAAMSCSGIQRWFSQLGNNSLKIISDTCLRTSNLERTLQNIVIYKLLSIDKPYASTCFGHVMSKACQYAINITKCKGMSKVSMKNI
jgi:hypothetical protein